MRRPCLIQRGLIAFPLVRVFSPLVQLPNINTSQYRLTYSGGIHYHFIITMSGEPSHYEVTLTEQLPPPIPRTVRIAARLSHLPVELVEPVIKDLPLFRVLELLAVPTCGPSLVRAIEHSPSWSWLFKSHITRLRRMWASINRLSWLWCNRPYICVTALPQRHHLRLTSPEIRRRNTFRGSQNEDTEMIAEDVRRALDDCVILGLRRLLGCDLYNVRPSAGDNVYFGFSMPQIRALCIFLPTPILSAIMTKSVLGFQEALRSAVMPQNRQDCLAAGEEGGKDFQLSTGDISRRDLWTIEIAHMFLPFLAKAHKLLKESYSAELLSMAELHERFPGKLKPPFAPQAPPKNVKHVAAELRRDARRVLTTPLRTYKKVLIHPNSKQIFSKVGLYRFRYPDTPLIPFNWCFILFEAVRRQYPRSTCASKYPKELLPALVKAEAGLHMIYHRNPGHYQGRYARLMERVDDTGMPNATRLDAILQKHPDYAPFLHYVSGAPRPLRELSWLKAFLTCVEWMEKQFRTLGSACQALGECNTRDHIRALGSDLLFSPPDYGRFYDKFVAGAPAEVIASRLLQDSALCDNEDEADPVLVPSALVLHLPDFSSPRGRQIAEYLVTSAEDIGIDAQKLRYDSVKEKITRYLQKPRKLEGHDDGYRLACELTDERTDEVTYTNSDQASTYADESNDTLPARPSEISESDVDVASRVLRQLLESCPQHSGSVTDALDILSKLSIGGGIETQEQTKSETGTWDEAVKTYLSARPARSLPGNDGLPRCYICRLTLHVPHGSSPSLCIPCGDFNAAGSELSMPGNLDLSGKTALMTGARVNLGYHVALRLLRCGARVIASTRYPQDAVARYEAEPDAKVWIDRLRVVGADFRAARDAFDLVNHTRSIIATWGGRLDILINNAAQTLTDSVKIEGQAVAREKLLRGTVSPTPLLLQQQQYEARVRGGGQALIEGPASDFSKDLVPATDDRSSWVQSLAEIPYEDVISAHSVNTFVPLILIRELLPLMGEEVTRPTSPSSASPSSPQHAPRRPAAAGYIVNVSSREGIFETSRSNPHKAGRHVHTNMSKAGLNMITETEGGSAWARRRVAMNTVDPGYMSAAPELEEAYGGVRPVGWEDGAGRVLWPVAIGEGGSKGSGGGDGGVVVWGRFLKHYGAVRVEPGWGRG